MRCSSDVLKKTSPLDVFGDVSEKVKHLTNDAFNDVSCPALLWVYVELFSHNASGCLHKTCFCTLVSTFRVSVCRVSCALGEGWD